MKGYFGIGIYNVTKPMNVGNLVRTAHAFGAAFIVFVAPQIRLREIGLVDTSDTAAHVPVYVYDRFEEMRLPKGCELVAIEFVDQSIPMPSFRHPRRAVYMLGPELDSLPGPVLTAARHVVHIPTAFCVNVATAGALTMYDRLVTLGPWEPRPVMPGGPVSPLEGQAHEPLRGGHRLYAHPEAMPQD